MSCANEIPMDDLELDLLLDALNSHREKLFRHHRDTPALLERIDDLKEKLLSWL